MNYKIPLQRIGSFKRVVVGGGGEGGVVCSDVSFGCNVSLYNFRLTPIQIIRIAVAHMTFNYFQMTHIFNVA